MSLHILHLYKDYYPILGGIENHIRALAEAQAAAGHRVTVLVTNPGGQPASEMINGVQVLRASRLATVASTPLTFAFPALLHRLAPDITHLQFPYPIGEISQFFFGKRPYVISYQSDVTRPSQQVFLRRYRPLLGRVLRQSARLLCSSQAYINTSSTLQPLRDHCIVVPLGIDPTPFLNTPPKPQREQPPARPTLLFVGRHRHYKGVDGLIRAMPHLDADLLIAGSGPLRAEWQRLADEVLADCSACGGAAPRPSIRFIGDVADADLPALYASADIFVLPSNARSEAFGLVLLEAMAAGLPCVTTELGTGTSYIVQDGLTGLVVPPRDPAALAAALQRLLDDPPLRRQMGQAGRARLLAEFTVARMVERVMAVYAECLEPYAERQ